MKELVIAGNLYLAQPPLFRITQKDLTFYAMDDDHKDEIIKKNFKSNSKIEISRFKGLGEISPNEFKHFIGPDMRLDPVFLAKEDRIQDLLSYFMGKNTKERQDFIIDNLRVEEDIVDV